ncbi:hypothetical protein [Yersinia kristensenii]|uniref:hypothetical protein n=1 Tax=Yersinia kristensenii TaxID=28152 RepID=UPI001FE8FA04|nr:hypothetical protein [Yersinia kristensenii]
MNRLYSLVIYFIELPVIYFLLKTPIYFMKKLWSHIDMSISIKPTNVPAPDPDVSQYLTLRSDTSQLRTYDYIHHADGTPISGRKSTFIQTIQLAKSSENFTQLDVNDNPSLKYSTMGFQRPLIKFRLSPLARLPPSVERGPTGTRIIIKDIHDGVRTISHFRYDNNNKLIESHKFNYKSNGQLIDHSRYNYDESGNKIKSSEKYYINGNLDYQSESKFNASGRRDSEIFVGANYDENGNVSGYYEQDIEFDGIGHIVEYRTKEYDINGNESINKETIDNTVTDERDISLLIEVMGDFQVKESAPISIGCYDINNMSSTLVPNANQYHSIVGL